MKGERASKSYRLVKEYRHDVYRGRKKLRDGMTCTKCGAVFMAGRWTWDKSVPSEGDVLCPACQRIADRFPSGFVRMGGTFFAEHRDEIMNLVRNTEEMEKSLHPLERIMEVKDLETGAEVTTTGIHLARRIGESLNRSYQGEYTIRYEEGESRVRVAWER